MSGIKYTSRDYSSILKDLVTVSPELSQSYDPQSENDPATFLLKNIAQLGDVLSMYLDKRALETAPATMTERKVANNYYRMMGYYMDWYRPAKSRVTINNRYVTKGSAGFVGEDIKIPKYTGFRSISGDVSAVLLSDTDYIIIPAATVDPETGLVITPGSRSDIYLYEGTVRSEGSNIVPTDNKFRLSPAADTIFISSTEVRDESGTIWTRVNDIDKHPQLGTFYDVYVDENEAIYIRFSPYINQTTSSISSIRYVASKGEGTAILSGSLINCRIELPTIPVNTPSLYPNTNATNIWVSESDLSDHATMGAETPQEAYVNSQIYINTADTLITPLDYYNAVRRSTEISNCAITDAATEPSTTGKYPTFTIGNTNYYITGSNVVDATPGANKSYAISNNQFTIGSTTYTILSNNGVIIGVSNGPNFYKIFQSTELDLLTYRVRWVWENFDYSVDTGRVIGEINQLVNANKHVRLSMDASTDYFVLTWQPQGTITLRESVNREEANSILSTVCKRLSEDYHPSKVKFGTGISLLKLIDNIKSYDARILLVDLKPIQYKITQPISNNADALLIQLYIDYILGTGMSPEVINPVTGDYYRSNRHWTKYVVPKNSMSGINVNQYIATDLSTVMEGVNTGVSTDPGALDVNDLQLDPSDFFHVTHPFKSISIPRFANYLYYNGTIDAPNIDGTGLNGGLNGFLNNVKINSENII